MKAERVTTEQLRPGDTIRVWWSPGRDTITRLRPYTGPLECLDGAQVAGFALYTSKMTLEKGDLFDRIIPG